MKGRLVVLKGDKNSVCLGDLGRQVVTLGVMQRDRRVYLVSNCWDQTKKYETIINYVRVGCGGLTAEIVQETAPSVMRDMICMYRETQRERERERERKRVVTHP